MARGQRRIVGTRGDDVLDGNRRDNILLGKAGDDILVGGRGDDVATGGRGADTFVFNKGHDHDLITDFQDGIDLIDLNGFGLSGGFRSLRQLFEQSGDDVVIDFGDGDTLTIADISISDLSRDDFF